MNKEQIEKFENGFPKGVYAVPSNHAVKVRALLNYCKENNINPAQLNEEEIEQFIEKKEK